MASYPLQFPCPCFKEMEKAPRWVHGCPCRGTIYLHLDGDLECKVCERKSFIQNWQFGCLHDNDSKAEGKWIELTDIGQMFTALGRTAAAMGKAGALASDMAVVAQNISARWDHARTRHHLDPEQVTFYSVIPYTKE